MVHFISGDLTTMKVDAIVNAANIELRGGGGLDGQIHETAGPELDIECEQIGGCQRGEAKISNGYNLPAKYIIHTVGPIFGQHHGEDQNILYSCYYESLRLADENNIRTIAFPYVSAGVYGYPKEQVKHVAVQALSDYVDDFPDSSIDDIYFVDYDPTILD